MGTLDIDVTVDGPWFWVDEEFFSFPSYGLELPMRNLQIFGGFTSDGANLEGMTMSLMLDTRDLAALVTAVEGPTYEDGCGLLAFYGMECEVCPQDGVKACVTVQSEGFSAYATSVDVIPITEPGTHPDCVPTEIF